MRKKMCESKRKENCLELLIPSHRERERCPESHSRKVRRWQTGLFCCVHFWRGPSVFQVGTEKPSLLVNHGCAGISETQQTAKDGESQCSSNPKLCAASNTDLLKMYEINNINIKKSPGWFKNLRWGCRETDARVAWAPNQCTMMVRCNARNSQDLCALQPEQAPFSGLQFPSL